MNNHEFILCEKRKAFISYPSHCLVLGGPGCGKTTMSLLKAGQLIEGDAIQSYQRVLFLSFARSTISRVVEASLKLIPHDSRKKLEINTYHGFCWALLRSHGYLIGLGRKLALIAPSDIAARVAEIRLQEIPIEDIKRQVRDELITLAFNQGIIAFDLFAELVAKLLSENPKLAKIICSRYPTIILDEFQDTNAEEWRLIQLLGANSTLVTLADPDQRIFEFRGADPARIREFLSVFDAETYDFGNENNRSAGTDITRYGNDILIGANKAGTYSDVLVHKWSYIYRSSTFVMKTKVIEAIDRLKAGNTTWNLAILVPTKRLIFTVSDALTKSENRLPTVYHSVSIDPEGPTLAARVIALLLQPIDNNNQALELLVSGISLFYRGKGGGSPGTTDLGQSKSFNNALEKAKEKGRIPTNSIIKPCHDLVQLISQIKFTGDPEKDWVTITRLLADSSCKRLNLIAEQSKYVRLLNKGSQLREELSDTWRRNRSYLNAVQIVEAAFIQDHFNSTTRPLRGIIVMNMHKAKGKEFDEVILFEDQFTGRYFSANGNIDQSRLNLRVSVTRAKKRTTILTPEADPSTLLY